MGPEARPRQSQRRLSSLILHVPERSSHPPGNDRGLAESTSLEELRRIEPKAQEVRRRYMEELGGADVRELAIHRRVSRLSYSRRCAEASAVKAHLKQGIPLAPGMEIGYVVKDAGRWEVGLERTAAGFDSGYYGKLLEKAWEEVRFVFR